MEEYPSLFPVVAPRWASSSPALFSQEIHCREKSSVIHCAAPGRQARSGTLCLFSARRTKAPALTDVPAQTTVDARFAFLCL